MRKALMSLVRAVAPQKNNMNVNARIAKEPFRLKDLLLTLKSVWVWEETLQELPASALPAVVNRAL